MSAGPIVEIRGLTKAYGSSPPALRDVNLEIQPGVTGLLGPNGAGKSTLLQCVLGLLPDFTGDVRVLGLDARRDRRALRRKVGFVPEAEAYIWGLTGLHAVRYLGQLSGMPRHEALRRAHEVLWYAGLGEAAYRKVNEYSTGMRQRFKLAQALVHDPELIFLDEPLAGLDPQGRRQLRDLIRGLSDNHGKHIVWSSHLLPDVQAVADAVVVLQHGRDRGAFRMEDLAATEERYRVETEGEPAPFAEAVAPLGVRLEPIASPGEGAELTAHWDAWCPDGVGATQLLDVAHRAGIRVRSVSPRAEELEDVFLRILEPQAGAHD